MISSTSRWLPNTRKLRRRGPKGGGDNPWAKNMAAHCKALSTEFEKVAADAQKMADYYTARAKELQTPAK